MPRKTEGPAIANQTLRLYLTSRLVAAKRKLPEIVAQKTRLNPTLAIAKTAASCRRIDPVR